MANPAPATSLIRERSVAELEQLHREAAEDLQHSIKECCAAYKRFTSRMEDYCAAVNVDLANAFAIPISMHLAKAGLAPFLDRKLQGKCANLSAALKPFAPKEFFQVLCDANWVLIRRYWPRWPARVVAFI